MKRSLNLLFIILICSCQHSGSTNDANAVSSVYSVSFENAVHHEANVTAVFKNLPQGAVHLTMSRTSPGRYAMHEFVKNVYGIEVVDLNNNEIGIEQIDPYSWKVTNHNGAFKLSYTLFGNYGEGTYVQIDESHAHMNMPASFMYVKELENKPIEITFDVRQDLNWKVATQLKHINSNTYYAKDLQYFLDSPTEISDHSIRSFVLDGQTINFVLHHNGTEREFDTFFESVKKIVLAQKDVFGTLPTFDHGNYYFLGCYLPQVSGDAMEHRNSTYLTTTRTLAEGGITRNLGSVAHEFFHVWNVERLRPQSLEPFDFSKANMSGELWFSEGFTNYYDGLSIKRAGLISTKDYVNSLQGVFNYVWNSPGRHYYNPIEMSYQAVFVDRATSADPNNRSNTFISYYSYGDMLGLALDLALRERGLDLDAYMQLLWQNFGRQETPFTINDLQNTLEGYAGSDFASTFFDRYIHDSNMPDMARLFEQMGIALQQDSSKAWFGRRPQNGVLSSNTLVNSPAYEAGLEKGDVIVSIGQFDLRDDLKFESILEQYKPNDKVKIVYERHGMTMETELVFKQDPTYTIKLFEEMGRAISPAQSEARKQWLGSND